MANANECVASGEHLDQAGTGEGVASESERRGFGAGVLKTFWTVVDTITGRRALADMYPPEVRYHMKLRDDFQAYYDAHGESLTGHEDPAVQRALGHFRPDLTHKR